MSKVKGYKVFNSDWTCRGFQYEVGKIFTHEGQIELCGKGFHFCQKASDCFNYYSFDSNNKVAEVEALDLVETKNDKSVTNKIHIIREISWQELLTLVNSGKNCTGLNNTGNRNTGNRNTGDCNTGNRNTGNRNTGNRNTGNCNTGNRNTGNYNTGNYNTGSWNAGDCNTGMFSTITPKVTMFEKETNYTIEEARKLKGIQILNWNYENNWWIYERNMTEEEKEQHPEYKTTGGYLKTIPFKEACVLMWGNLSEEEKEEVLNLPNFNKEIFYKITGIEV